MPELERPAAIHESDTPSSTVPTTRLEYLRARPAEFEAYLVRIGLPAEMRHAPDHEIRHVVVERMLEAAKGRTLGLHGMSVREFAHEDHLY